ncbi:hypothetical protein SAMN04488061_1618 [Filomicrobium insigne]|uniref:Uncharacterized protein n=1 Tax=Filomicrobium insigne TaxID=418854 RepID=A0A1H0MA55_9HYPH|nr:hypothetical protein SAMN04488061_1618 [Filomicrobium insigne]
MLTTLLIDCRALIMPHYRVLIGLCGLGPRGITIQPRLSNDHNPLEAGEFGQCRQQGPGAAIIGVTNACQPNLSWYKPSQRRSNPGQGGRVYGP